MISGFWVQPKANDLQDAYLPAINLIMLSHTTLYFDVSKHLGWAIECGRDVSISLF